MATQGVREQRFTAVYREHYPAVLAYARRRSDPDIAADVAGEVFLVAWRRLEEVPGTPLPWLLGTARLVLANTARGQRRAERHLARTAHLERGAAVPDLAAAVSERDRVMAALRRLSADDQEVVLLTAWEGLDPTGAAAVLGCTAATARVRLHRARRRLRVLLAEHPPPGARPPAPVDPAPPAPASRRPALRTEVL